MSATSEIALKRNPQTIDGHACTCGRNRVAVACRNRARRMRRNRISIGGDRIAVDGRANAVRVVDGPAGSIGIGQ